MFPLHTHFLERLGYPRGKPLLEKIGCPPRTPPSRKPQIFRGFGYPREKPLLEKIGYPPRAPPSRKPQIFWGIVRYPREKPLLEKIGCPPRTPLSRKPLLFIILFYPLIQASTSIRLKIRIRT